MFITENMLKTNSDIFLDDKTVSDVEQALGIEIMPVATDGYGAFDAILGEGRIYETEKKDIFVSGGACRIGSCDTDVYGLYVG